MKQLIKLLLLLSIAGCYTAKKADKDINKAYDKFPVVVDKFCQTKFPCITLSADTINLFDTSYSYLPCPEMPILIDTIINDSIQKVKIYVPKKVISKIVITKIIEKRIKDSAEIFSYQVKLDSSNKEKDKWIEKNEKKSNVIKWLFIILFISIVINYILIIRK
jgi:hypothetical protein